MTNRPPISRPATGAGELLAGRYRLGNRIGRGGMANVYRADDELLGRPVAVKVFRFDTDAGQDRLRMEAEVRVLASLRHPGLVTVFDAGTVGETVAGDTVSQSVSAGGLVAEATPFIVMELIDGPTLGQRLADGPLPADQTAMLGAELAATLQYVHANNVVHRDVKPANILLDTPIAGHTGYAAKLTDFGIARLLDGTRITMHGMTIGTANYLSPEQAEGTPAGPESDMYSLGLVLLECLTGELAYSGGGVEAALARLHRPPQIPERFGPGWISLLSAMTARFAHLRPSATEAHLELSSLAASPAGLGLDLLGATPAEAVAGPAANADPAVNADPSAAAPAPSDPLGAAEPETAQLPLPSWRRLRAGVPVRYAAAAAVLLVLVLSVVLVTAHFRRHSASQTAPPPSYPSVPGKLGSDLRQLQGSVP